MICIAHRVFRHYGLITSLTALCLIIPYFSFSQKITPPRPKFISDDKSKLSLSQYLSESILNSDKNDQTGVIKIKQGCIEELGIFSFYILSNGDVHDVKCEGNLSKNKVELILNQILSTSGKWIPEKENGIPKKSQKFIYHYYYSSILPSCESVKSNCSGLANSIRLLFETIKSNEFIDNGLGYYLIRPTYIVNIVD